MFREYKKEIENKEKRYCEKKWGKKQKDWNDKEWSWYEDEVQATIDHYAEAPFGID